MDNTFFPIDPEDICNGIRAIENITDTLLLRAGDAEAGRLGTCCDKDDFLADLPGLTALKLALRYELDRINRQQAKAN